MVQDAAARLLTGAQIFFSHNTQIKATKAVAKKWSNIQYRKDKGPLQSTGVGDSNMRIRINKAAVVFYHIQDVLELKNTSLTLT